MLGLPERTLYDRRIPKNRFYEKLRASSSLREKFVEDVDHIVWKHKLSRETVNLDPTDEVEEIQVFEIHLKKRDLAKEVLESIDRAIPYPVLHVILHENEAKLAIAFKKRNRNNENRYVIEAYYHSDWKSEAELEDMGSGFLNGLDLGAVYANMLRALMPVKAENEESLEDASARNAAVEKLQRECSRLESAIKNERQFDRKVALNIELQKKKKELENTKGNTFQLLK